MRALILGVLILVVGCDPVGGNDGPLMLGIVAGNNQTATAGSTRLTDPVVGKLVRQPDGGITFRLVTPAYAQTVVQGSPVPGALVCAVSISEGGMVPWVPCTQTDSAGTATFFFTPGTRADTVRSEIRGEVKGKPAVFDTAVAVVEPSALVAWGVGEPVTVSEGDTIRLDTLAIAARDEYFNAIPVDDLTGLTVRWTWQAWSKAWPTDMPADAGVGWTVVVPAGSSGWGTGSNPDAALVAWIGDVRNGISFRVNP